MNVVIYSRVSSQTARQSTERQVTELRKFAINRGYRVCTVFEEKISGRKANLDRPVLLNCLEYCTNPQNKVDMLLVTEISRLGRSTLELLKALDTLHRHKVSVYIQNLNIETLLPDKTVNPLSSLITTLLGELAAMERQGILDRLNSGRAVGSNPNHLNDLVFWNYKETDEGNTDFDFWANDSKFWKFLPPIIVVFHGAGTTFLSSQVKYEESNGKPVNPESLYEAQLELRLGKLPQWIIERLKNNVTFRKY